MWGLTALDSINIASSRSGGGAGGGGGNANNIINNGFVVNCMKKCDTQRVLLLHILFDILVNSKDTALEIDWEYAQKFSLLRYFALKHGLYQSKKAWLSRYNGSDNSNNEGIINNEYVLPICSGKK